MNSATLTAKQIFTQECQFLVPFYQRNYVWNEEDQWERLWEDIQAKADTRAAGDDTSPHYMGALVLEEQKRKTMLGIKLNHVIDGQQRLTTLQFVLSALKIAAKRLSEASIEVLVDNCLRNHNTGIMLDKKHEPYKLRPTFRDHAIYMKVMDCSSLEAISEAFPDHFTKHGTFRKIGMEHPPALAGVMYFSGRIEQWLGETGAPAGAVRLNALAAAVFEDLAFIAINLEPADDAQMIFETMNGRGARLHATDLIKNFIFMRADRDSEDSRDLYDTLWEPFDHTESGWSKEMRRGRMKRPTIEWFMQAALGAETGDEVDLTRLFAEYRKYAEKSGSAGKGKSAREQLTRINLYADHYRQLHSGTPTSAIARFGCRLEPWDITTADALALAIATSGVNEGEAAGMYDDLMSFIVRRAICGLTRKSYNKTFLGLLKSVSTTGINRASLRDALTKNTGEISRWPPDLELKAAILRSPLYPGLAPKEMKAVLVDLEHALRSDLSETPVPYGLDILDVDHIMPTSWTQHWNLSGDIKVTEQQLSHALVEQLGATTPSPLSQSIIDRNAAIRTLGNLTLAHYGINRSYQNREFAVKRQRIFETSNLNLNRDLMLMTCWDEQSIKDRGEKLFAAARKAWPRPE